MSMMYVTHPCIPKTVGTQLADRIGIATTTSTLLRHLMLVDQAGWHRSRELQLPANIRLIEQPAYSPEVNPVKHVWEELREKYLHNRVFPSLDPLVEILCQDSMN
jgi:transposase